MVSLHLFSISTMLTHMELSYFHSLLYCYRNVNEYNSTTNGVGNTVDTNSTFSNATDMPLAGVDNSTSDPLLSIEGECTGVPTSAQLTVMYTLSGRSAGAPIYQIAGAKVQ